MAEVIRGNRIGKIASLSPSCCAVIFDTDRNCILLTRRADNDLWCLPGGAMDPGESAAEACAREVLEETGLIVTVKHLVGIYSSPHMIVRYKDGNQIQGVTLCFVAVPVGGKMGLSDETTAVGFYTRDEMQFMNVWEHQLQRIDDAISGRTKAFVR